MGIQISGPQDPPAPAATHQAAPTPVAPAPLPPAPLSPAISVHAETDAAAPQLKTPAQQAPDVPLLPPAGKPPKGNTITMYM
jgi:hypothetical protein